MALKNEKIITSLVFDKDDYKKLKRIALEEEKSISALIRELIKEFIKKNEIVIKG